ncbi:hypothetical protein [Nocardia amamiensis]|uniref:hypothetical protein n=1 Tax=Nocardia amamiensis TaxID=404578 RepID=UPI003403AB35
MVQDGWPPLADIGPAGWLHITNAYVALLQPRLNQRRPDLGLAQRHIKPVLTAASIQYRLDIPTIHARQGDIYGVGFHGNYIGIGYKLATVARWIINQPWGTEPRHLYYWSRCIDGPGYPVPRPFISAATASPTTGDPGFYSDESAPGARLASGSGNHRAIVSPPPPPPPPAPASAPASGEVR